jgi:hypothetical protein
VGLSGLRGAGWWLCYLSALTFTRASRNAFATWAAICGAVDAYGVEWLPGTARSDIAADDLAGAFMGTGNSSPRSFTLLWN